MKDVKIDRSFFVSILILSIAGFFIFSSASLGLLARGEVSFKNVAFNQAFFGLFFGFCALAITSSINYKFWKRYALYLFLASIVLTVLVFVPGLGFEHGGAKRWISLGSFSFQPSEFLKIGFIIYFAAWLSGAKEKIQTFFYGLVPFCVLLAITGAILLSQPDTDTFVVIFIAGVAMFITAGGRWRHVLILMLIAIIGLFTVALMRPYLMDRLTTFINPAHDSLGASYQIQQSLIAIGSGGLFGRGFGQSVQKFHFLPEPIGDSIFAVAAEEFGFGGSVIIVLLFVFFAFRGFKIASRSPDSFSGLLTIGIVILIVSQSFLNMGSMLGVLPLSGIPLLFVSHGGTALLMVLAEVGIILNISKYARK